MSLLMLVILAPIAFLVVLTCLRKPLSVALPAFAASIPFGSLLAVGHSRFGSLSSILGLLVLIGLVLRLAVSQRQPAPLSGTVFLWLGFLAVASSTTLWSLDPGLTANGILEIGSLIAIYVLVSMSPIDRDILRRVEQGLIVGGLAAVAYGMVQFTLLGGFPNDTPGLPPSPTSRFGNDLLGPNNNAVAFLLPLCICLQRSVTAPRASTRRLHAGFAFLMFLGIVMTGSRGGMLSAVLCLLVLIAVAPWGRRTLATYLVTAIAAGLIAFFLHPFGLAERNVSTTSTSGRTSIWKVGLAACPEYCTVGSGWDTFPIVYALTQPTVPGADVLAGSGGSYQPHNVILLVAIELGVPGLLLFFAVLGLTIFEAGRLPRSVRGPPLAALLGTYQASLFLSNLGYKFYWMAFIMVALHRSASYMERSRERAAELEPVS
ncbi:O-antigen ligase family protein [Nocardioides cynanchi]|uniref:O-antigen ligase family protein n=1 Tax=Nocardioides cynanchi TaxID=2558918 RepID=UPI0012479FC8|nr:O-antigen ligase family protein [Nocardioides cynanchi]